MEQREIKRGELINLDLVCLYNCLCHHLLLIILFMRVRVDDDLSSSLNQSDISLFARFCRINEGIPKYAMVFFYLLK